MVTPMKLLRLSVLLISALIVSGCTSLSKQECASANWQQIGFEDGSKGAASTRFSDHIAACEGISTPNAQAWNAGRSEGLRGYCTSDGGYWAGRSGIKYQGVCPPETVAKFLPAYQHGRQYYEISRTIRELEFSYLQHNNYYYSGLNSKRRYRNNYGYGYSLNYGYGPNYQQRLLLNQLRTQLAQYGQWPAYNYTQ